MICPKCKSNIEKYTTCKECNINLKDYYIKLKDAYEKGCNYYKQKNFEKASIIFNQIVSLDDPNYSQFKKKSNIALSHIKSISKDENNDVNNNDPHQMLDEALKLYSNGSYDMALTILNEILSSKYAQKNISILKQSENLKIKIKKLKSSVKVENENFGEDNLSKANRKFDDQILFYLEKGYSLKFKTSDTAVLEGLPKEGRPNWNVELILMILCLPICIIYILLLWKKDTVTLIKKKNGVSVTGKTMDVIANYKTNVTVSCFLAAFIINVIVYFVYF